MLGIDLSHQNGIIDFQKQKANGVSFCILKATEGNAFTDPKYAYNLAQAAKAGILTGAYHFYHSNLDPVDQANFFLKVSGGRKMSVLDWEVSDNMRISVQKSRALQFLEAVEAKTGFVPFIYASPGFLAGLGDLSAFAKYPWWVAEYGVTSPRIVSPFKNWVFWQYSDSNGMDLDTFRGDSEELAAYF